ncbi:MAG TPA: XdhC/CoxI family protein [Gemmatimonadales bacterium]|nr:XdhC/CoxI family protein [Gemmatimonadales bacterium]
MRDLLNDYDRFVKSGRPFGRAVVTSVWGSAPRPEGASMLASSDGTIAGSVSGGCVESATALEIEQAIERGSPKLVTFGVTDERAWEVGLACGGTIRVFVEPRVRTEVLEAARGPGGEVLVSVIDGPGVGRSLLVSEDGRIEGTLPMELPRDAVRQIALDALRREASTSRGLESREGPVTLFFEVFPRQPRLVIFGGVQIAVALVPLAKALGYHTIVADGREAFLERDRFPDADELILAWPEEAFERIRLDSSCYVCVLSHDPKFDEPALQIALRSPAGYVGAIGSRKTQEARRDRLREAGLSPEQIARLHGPIGLDLGGRQPAETALAILAEMTAVRFGGSASRRTPGPRTENPGVAVRP